MKTPVFVYDLSKIHAQLHDLARKDCGTTEADRRTRSYYQDDHHSLVWIDRMGIDARADSLVAWLRLLHETGLSEDAFGVADIERDIQRIRGLYLDEGQHSINRVAARLEYQLTKACLRYCYGQRFGFVNPTSVFNNLDIERMDTIRGIVNIVDFSTYKWTIPISIMLPSYCIRSELTA